MQDHRDKRTDNDDDDKLPDEEKKEVVATQELLTAISGKYSMEDEEDDDYDDLLKKQPEDAWNLAMQHSLDTYQSSTSITSSMIDSERLLQKEQTKPLPPSDAQGIAQEIIHEKKVAAGLAAKQDDLKAPDRFTSLATTTPPPPDLGRRDNYRKVNHPGAVAMDGLTPAVSTEMDDQTIQVGEMDYDQTVQVEEMDYEKAPSPLLADAVLVVEESLEQSSSQQQAVAAVPFHEDNNQRGVCSVFYDRRVACIFIFLIIIITALASGLSMLFLRNDDNEQNIPTAAPGPAPTFSPQPTLAPVPTAAPTARFDWLMDLLQDFVDDTTPWEDTATPQYKALDWLAYVDAWTPLNIENSGVPIQAILERYALAVVYMSFNGDNWVQESEFLNIYWRVCDWQTLYCYSANDCETFGVTCTGQFVTGLSLDRVGAVGEIPTEVGLLSSLEYLWLDSNSLFGSIPPELFELSNLQSVTILDNGLSGTLPSEIGLATELYMLDLSENLIGGTLDNVVGPSMEYLALQSNLLEGTIPPDFGLMTNIYHLDLGYNRLSGPLPTNLANLESLAVLSLYDNVDLTGTVPPAYFSFNLSLLYLEGTGLTNLEDVFCSSGLLEFEEFYADCGGTPSKVQCWCCTHCCDDINSCYAN